MRGRLPRLVPATGPFELSGPLCHGALKVSGVWGHPLASLAWSS